MFAHQHPGVFGLDSSTTPSSNISALWIAEQRMKTIVPSVLDRVEIAVQSTPKPTKTPTNRDYRAKFVSELLHEVPTRHETKLVKASSFLQ